jgi:hypothetical protein
MGILVDCGFSILKPITAGVKYNEDDPVEMISAMTPEFGVGSVIIGLPASLARVAVLAYTVTQDAVETVIFNSAYEVNPVSEIFAVAEDAKLTTVPVVIVLLKIPILPTYPVLPRYPVLPVYPRLPVYPWLPSYPVLPRSP